MHGGETGEDRRLSRLFRSRQAGSPLRIRWNPDRARCRAVSLVGDFDGG